MGRRRKKCSSRLFRSKSAAKKGGYRVKRVVKYKRLGKKQRAHKRKRRAHRKCKRR